MKLYLLKYLLKVVIRRMRWFVIKLNVLWNIVSINDIGWISLSRDEDGFENILIFLNKDGYRKECFMIFLL